MRETTLEVVKAGLKADPSITPVERAKISLFASLGKNNPSVGNWLNIPLSREPMETAACWPVLTRRYTKVLFLESTFSLENNDASV
jgi:hypothetical protein